MLLNSFLSHRTPHTPHYSCSTHPAGVTHHFSHFAMFLYEKKPEEETRKMVNAEKELRAIRESLSSDKKRKVIRDLEASFARRTGKVRPPSPPDGFRNAEFNEGRRCWVSKSTKDASLERMWDEDDRKWVDPSKAIDEALGDEPLKS